MNQANQALKWPEEQLAAWRNGLETGGGRALLCFLCFGALLLAFLYLTVHNRNPHLCKFRPRMEVAITTWIEDGFLRHGGLEFTGPYGTNPPPQAYRSYPMGHFLLAHLLERLNFWLRGGWSQTLMCLQSQVLVLFSSALLGWLVFRLARRLGLPLGHGLLLGAGAQMVYQTFPTNLYAWWDLYPPIGAVIPAIAFLHLQLVNSGEAKAPKWLFWARGMAVFAFFYCDHICAFFFFSTWLLLQLCLKSTPWREQRLLSTLLLPALLAMLLFSAQVMLVKYTHPEVEFYGSSFLFRSGLDGSRQYVDFHSDIFHRYRFPTADFPTLFFGGLLGALAAVIFLLLDYWAFLPTVIALGASVGLYVPSACMLMQSTIIHPYSYDTYLAVPLTLALFGILPLGLEKKTGQRGIFVFIFTLFAFGLAMVQLRNYAMLFPIPDGMRLFVGF